ncbi:aldehyde dehydrogenase family protein [Microbacterium sp. A84]|uniref:aldehyde dehydrogenase family protein n=1 Tax=Microbacterium sp. A84 TaxID=3450715 RepID=UPI003F41B740
MNTAAQHLYIDGQWIEAESSEPIVHRWSGESIGQVDLATAAHATQAANAAVAALRRGFPVDARVTVLANAAKLLEERREEAAQLITAEMGKPISSARGEVDRAISVLSLSSQEAMRLPAEAMNLEGTQSAAGIISFTLPVPLGAVAAITPFNFPINLVAHKVGPALAAGCPVVLKPSDKGRLVAGLFTRLLIEAGLPAGYLNLVTGPAEEVVPVWLEHPGIATINFTGSSAVGWKLKAASPRKHHVLELGSNTALVVDRDADLQAAAASAAQASMLNSGQACISLQRVFVHRDVVDDFSAALAIEVAAVKSGDPTDAATLVGPLVSDENVTRIQQWVQEAAADGARILTGGTASSTKVFAPTALLMEAGNAKLLHEEAFGPVVVVVPVDSIEEAIDQVNSVDYGLNASIYTDSMRAGLAFAKQVESGAALINIPPHFRSDQMPYGGVKNSGQGREGVRYAVAEMLQQKLVLLRG